MISREPVFAALWNQIQNAPLPGGMTWGKKGRRVVFWEDVAPADQPALFLQEGPQHATQPTYGLPQWEWEAYVWIYFRADLSPNQDSYPDLSVNTFIDAIENAIRNVGDDPLQTLGVTGVIHARIDGTVLFDSALVDPQAIIRIPVKILVGA